MKNITKTRTLFGASLIALAFSLFVTHNVQAQSCTTPPSCTDLGYVRSASECATIALKCPFDQSKYYCLTADELADLGGGGTGSCKVPNFCDILFSDMSCGSSLVDGKRAIGIIFEPDKRLAIALQSLGGSWSTEDFDIPELTNYDSKTEALGDWSGKSNTLTAFNYCKTHSKSCPAFEAVTSYSTMGTKTGDWYLPALGELNIIYQNRNALDNLLTKVNGQTFPTGNYHKSSSEKSNNRIWGLYFDSGYASDIIKNGSSYVRPVLQF